jgi:hypothetical protein
LRREGLDPGNLEGWDLGRRSLELGDLGLRDLERRDFGGGSGGRGLVTERSRLAGGGVREDVGAVVIAHGIVATAMDAGRLSGLRPGGTVAARPDIGEGDGDPPQEGPESSIGPDVIFR